MTLSLWNVCWSSLWTIFASHEVFFQPELERAGCFTLLFSFRDSDWFSSMLFVEWYDSSIPIASASLEAFLPSVEIINLVSRVMKFALPYQIGLHTHSNDPMASLIPKNILDAGFVHDTWMPGVCPIISIQHADHASIQCLGFGALALCFSETYYASLTSFNCSCTWSWLRAEKLFAVLWINMQMDISQTSTRGL